MSKLEKSYGRPDINCPWCDRSLICNTSNDPLDPIFWNCYCGNESIVENLNFDISTTPDMKMTGFDVIKDCGNGFLQLKWHDGWIDNGQQFPASWMLEFYLSDQSSSQLLCKEDGALSIQNAKEIVLRYANLLVFT